MSDKTETNGKVTEIEKKTDAQLTQEVTKRFTSDEYAMLAKIGKCTVVDVKKEKIRLLKMEENSKYQAWKRTLDTLRSELVEENVAAHLMNDVPPEVLNREMKRKYPQYFITA